MMNLVKYLSACGAASRRKAELLIREGKVSVDGVPELNPASRIAPGMSVTLDGRVLNLPEKRHYFLLNKPRGYVCSNSDRHAEKLAVELFDMPQLHLVSAGRLDKDSEGAIIFSDDGEFINRLAHPRYGILKHYIIETRCPLTDTALERIRSGIRDDGELLQVHAITPIAPCRYEVVLNEGKKREIRRLTAAVGAPTIFLQRISIGPVKLGSLKSGEFRELEAVEIAALCSDG